MDQSDANQGPSFEKLQKPPATPKDEYDEISQEEIDQYMRMVGRMVYDIILDWVKKQQCKSEDAAGQPLNELVSSEGKDL